ncbi:MAG: DUF4870 domain-containing protein [Christensenellales bacterium]|jgi:uncharacterized membrane protein
MSEQKNSLGMDEKTAGWFAYLLSALSGIILLVSERDNRTVRTHAWQSLIMGCFFIAAYIVVAILRAIFMPVNPWDWAMYVTMFTFWDALNLILGIAWVVLTVICIVKAAQGDLFKLPVIYNKAKDLK